MENGQSTLAQLSNYIQALDRARFRLALIRVEPEWHLYAAVGDNLPASSRANWTSYDYCLVAFVTGDVRGAELVDWINQGHGQVNQYSFRIPPLQSSTNWMRYPSHTRFGHLGAGVPFTNHQLYAPQGRPQVPNNLGFLVSDTSPFFPDFITAVWRLLYDASDQNLSGQMPSELINVRLADRRAWIDSVHIAPTAMTVCVTGDDVRGVRLEVFAPPDSRLTAKIEQVGDVTFPLSSAVPPGTWIVLSYGQTVLDYRQLPPSAYGPTVDNLTIEVDAQTRIEELISGGESEFVEFKSEIPHERDRLLKTIAAFANGQGGTLLVGVSDDEPGTIVGVPQPASRELDRLVNMIRDVVTPNPEFHIEEVEYEGKIILLIHVEAGTQRPYGLHPDKPVFYVRRGASTFNARQDEIRALSQLDMSQPLRQSWRVR